MKNWPTFLAGIALAVVLVLYMVTFQLRFTEVAVVKTFGKFSEDDVRTDPKLYLKWPWPVQSVVKFDNRVRLMEDTTEETITADSKNVIVTVFLGWRVANPYLFHTSFPNEKRAEQILRNLVRSEKKAVIGTYEFSEFISLNEEDRKLTEIEQGIEDRVQQVCSTRYGIDIATLGVKRLTLPQSVSQAVFESMKKNEENKAARYKTEGEARAQEITSSAQGTYDRVMAMADKMAKNIISEGERIAGEYYKEFAKYPELRIFLDELEAVEQSLQERATLIFDTTQPPFNLFNMNHGGVRSDDLSAKTE